jgi:hypothetical protein
MLAGQQARAGLQMRREIEGGEMTTKPYRCIDRKCGATDCPTCRPGILLNDRERLSSDVARCAGVGSDEEGWREGCETCLRRITPGGHSHMCPPPIITFFCEYQIEGDAQ